MKTTSLVSKFLETTSLRVRRVLSRSLVALLVTTISTGCGLSAFKSSRSDLSSGLNPDVVTTVSAVNERPQFSSSGKGPKQLRAQAARVLPKPDFGITPEVQREIDRYLAQERGTVLQVLDRHSAHIDSLGKVFEEQGVPAELLSVAAVESRFNPQALSPAGARGMWQFMSSTARVYGLEISRGKDDRTDPLLSTAAAARHLRDLFVNYGDWHLALAAYNAGIGCINKVLARNGETSFWDLARNGEMPAETRRFVPRVIALSMIVKDPSRFGFEGVKAVG